MRRIKPFLKWVLVGVGFLSVGFGLMGIFLPVLPTTPLLLLAAACFMRSSPRLYDWLLHHKWFGDYIRHYREHRAVPLRAKIMALALLWLSIGSTVLFAVTIWWVRILLVAIAVGVTIHLVRLKTLTHEMVRSDQRVEKL